MNSTRNTCCEILKNVSAAYQSKSITAENRNAFADLVKETMRTGSSKKIKELATSLYLNSQSRYLGNIIDLILKEEK